MADSSNTEGEKTGEEILREMMAADPELAQEMDEPALAKKLMKEALPLAALGMIQLAQDSTNERMRFQANKYLLDRGLGALIEGGDHKTQEKDLYEQLLEKCVKDPN